MILLPISSIRLDGGTQPRATINPQTVSDYMNDMDSGAEFPPVDVFYDGHNHWLADGFHRINAAEKAGRGVAEAIMFATVSLTSRCVI